MFDIFFAASSNQLAKDNTDGNSDSSEVFSAHNALFARSGIYIVIGYTKNANMLIVVLL